MPGLFSLSRLRRNLQRRQHTYSLIARCPAHSRLRPQRRAKCRTLGLAEQPVAQVVVKLHAGKACGFAVRHAGNRRGDGASDEQIDLVFESFDRQAQLIGDALACYGALRVLVSESDGTSDAARTRLENIGYLPNFVVNFFAPENSLGIKYRTMGAQFQCNNWHQRMVADGC